LIADIFPSPTFYCNYPNIADRLAKQSEGRWKTVFPEGRGVVIELPVGGG
jgi:hypothetical protein